MSAAAEFRREFPGLYYPDDISVFFTEQRHSAQLFRFLNGHFRTGNLNRGKNLVVDDLLYSGGLLLSQSGKWVKSKRTRWPSTNCPACSTWVPSTFLNAAWSKWAAVWFLMILYRRMRLPRTLPLSRRSVPPRPHGSMEEHAGMVLGGIQNSEPSGAVG